MSTGMERAQILLEQNRPDLAGKELLQALPHDPDNPALHALLAACYADQERNAEALEHARKAVQLAPEWTFAMRTLARAELACDSHGRAMEAARTAVSMGPEESENHVTLAHVLLGLGQWREALEAADKALSLDPDDRGALNVRGIAMRKLGRPLDAEATIRASLAQNPEDDVTHANLGWSLLQAGRAREAIGHFREALRLDPQQEWARAGLAEALKARNPLYSVLLRFFLWQSRFSRRTQLTLMIAALLLVRTLSSLSRSAPALDLPVRVLVFAYMAFVFTSWFSVHLFNLILLTDRDGRHALSRGQQARARIFGAGLLATAAAVLLLSARAGSFRPGFGYLAVLWLFPLAVALRARPGAPRAAMSLYTLAAVAAFAGGLTGPRSSLLSLYILLCVAATWFASFVKSSDD